MQLHTYVHNHLTSCSFFYDKVGSIRESVTTSVLHSVWFLAEIKYISNMNGYKHCDRIGLDYFSYFPSL